MHKPQREFDVGTQALFSSGAAATVDRDSMVILSRFSKKPNGESTSAFGGKNTRQTVLA